MRLWRATAVAVTLLAVALGVAVGYAQDQVITFRIRGGDGSIYVDATGGYTFPLPYPVSGATFLLNYSSTYLQPRLLREVAIAVARPPPGVAAQPYYLALRVDSASAGGVGSASAKASYTSPAGSAALEVSVSDRTVGLEVELAATGTVVVDKELLPGDLRAQLPAVVSATQAMGAEGMSSQLTALGLGWVRVVELRVDLEDLGRSYRIPFRIVWRLDYAVYASTYGLDVGTVKRCLQLSGALSTSASLRLDLTPSGLEFEYRSERSAEDLERLAVELSSCSLELAKGFTAYAPPITPEPAQDTLAQFLNSLARLSNLSAGLVVLPSNSTVFLRIEVGGSVGIHVDVRNVRLTHLGGVEKASAAVVAMARALGAFRLNYEVELGGVPCDWSYADELADAIVEFAGTLLAAWFTPVSIKPVVVPLTPTPTETSVVITVPSFFVVTETVATTLTTTETVVRTDTVTVTQLPNGYGVAHLATVGTVALAVGVALGYLARRRS